MLPKRNIEMTFFFFVHKSSLITMLKLSWLILSQASVSLLLPCADKYTFQVKKIPCHAIKIECSLTFPQLTVIRAGISDTLNFLYTH